MARATYLYAPAVLTRTCLPAARSPAALPYSNNLRQIQHVTSKRNFPLFINQYKTPLKQTTALARRSFSSSTEEAFASAVDLQYEGPLKIVKYPDPVLRAKNKRVKTFDENLKKIVDEMFDIMYRTDGIGLSAPQVGINIQLMVFNTVGERGEGEEIVLVNPRISRYYEKIRPDSLKVNAQDITGAGFELNLTGLPARVFQHEYDHLLAMEQSYEERTGSPSPEKIDKRRRKMKAVGFGKS
ncbi:peptide deformylase 1B, chloroplastic [Dorcoceras hygrometricum]|uniref:Peptide deformylase n=1 Tax=Dorcoceras hygrometricum TaxID=472368 RepID=A0A2Z7ASQ7_9LAMI|nr:peptide deformylase 1B, chloroplastic [Dorcoceras hygrometricum]